MEFEDDDPAWLEACIAAVDSLPEANLPSASRAHRSDVNTPKFSSASSNDSFSITSTCHSLPSCPPVSSGSTSSRSFSKALDVGSIDGSLPSRQIGTSHESRDKMALKPLRHSSWTRGGPRRIHGIGINPHNERKRSENKDDVDVDPCWKCGEAVTLKDYGGSTRYYCCSSHPLCRVTRKTRKLGAMVELQAQEKYVEESGFFDVARCHLVMRIRGSHDGEVARAAWNVFKRNGIIPSDDAHNARVDNDGDNAGVGDEEPKAVLSLEERGVVLRLVKQEGLAFRDVPQTTYSRLVRLAAESRASNEKRANSAKSKLEQMEVCEALLYKLPSGLRETLLPFQRDGVLYGLRRRGRCLIADEMGTGKTLQALGVLGCYREDWPLLIVAPASMRLMWAEEVEHWYPFLAPGEIHIIKGSKDKLYLTELSRFLWPRVVIVSYFMLGRLAENIGREKWKAVIFDESHMISTKLGDSSSQARQTNVCLHVAKRAERVVMLSGTPSLSKPFDLFNQVEALAPGLLGGDDSLFRAKYNFASNYCGGTMRRKSTRDGSITRVPFISGSDYPDELHLLLKNEVMIRRLKINVVDQLPPLRRIVVRVVPSTEELKAALQAGGFEPDAEGDDGEGDNQGRPTRRTRWAGGMSQDQRAGLKKVKSASQWVVDKLTASAETRTKFVVFAHHKAVLDRLQEAFELAGTFDEGIRDGGGCHENDIAGDGGFTCLRIDGEVPTAVRAARLAHFNTEARCRVLLVSITAGGQGLDFTAASNVVFVELPESPTWLRQAEDRLHRRKQDKSVNVYLMVLPAGSNDDIRWLRLSEKLTTQTSVMNGVAQAESIKVDRVCDADTILTMDSGDRRKDPFRSRRRKGFGRCPADEDYALEEGEDEASGDSEDVHSDDGLSDDTRGGGLNDILETSLDEEMREALLFTPLDPSPNPNPQSPMLRLLHAIADSPALVSSSQKTTGFEKGSARALEKGGSSPCGGPSPSGLNNKTVDASAASSAVATLKSLWTPVSRKRPRPSPNSDDATGRSRNPFRPFRHPAFSPSPILPRDKQDRQHDEKTREDEMDLTGTLGTLGTPRRGIEGGPCTPKASQNGDGSAFSPLLLVDAASASEQGSDVDLTPGGGAGEVHVDQVTAGASLSEEGRDEGDVKFCLDSSKSRVRSERHEMEKAKKLLFLVSPNTGRVHVFEDCTGDDGESEDDDLDEGEKPRHCRCNFQPEDLDRLFEAAKQASLRSLGEEAINHCEAVAREVLDKLPDVLKSPPALRVARAFVQEWRALSSRKRPLLSEIPSRPPLAAKVAHLTSQLTGSTQRYRSRLATEPAATDGDGASSSIVRSSHTNGRGSSGRVMCRFCEGKPASSQGKVVHHRDRFCSVKCMEADGSRRSGASLRRLVCERDHGVCAREGCGRDCLALVSKLKAIQDHQKRREILLQADARFGHERRRKLRERLVQDPVAGHAWNADHVTAVYEGGGECDIDNVRTLCVLCHAEVTQKQTAERAAARRLSKENARRSIEEAQGQRRLVSFGGHITLSPPPSAALEQFRKKGLDDAGSTGHPSELDSDDSDAAILVPLERQKDDPSTRSSSASVTHMSDSGRPRAGRDAPSSNDRDFGGKLRERTAVRPSLEAFERLISGEDFNVDSDSNTIFDDSVRINSSYGNRNKDVIIDDRAETKQKRPDNPTDNGDGNGDGVAAGTPSSRIELVGERSDNGSGEISFTRVRRIRRTAMARDKGKHTSDAL